MIIHIKYRISNCNFTFCKRNNAKVIFLIILQLIFFLFFLHIQTEIIQKKKKYIDIFYNYIHFYINNFFPGWNVH